MGNILEKLIFDQLVKKLYGTGIFITVFKIVRHWTIFCVTWIQFTLYSFIHFNTILPSMSRLSCQHFYEFFHFMHFILLPISCSLIW